MRLPKSGSTVTPAQIRELMNAQTKRSEDDVEREICKALNDLGFIALHNGTRGVRGPTGASKGVPDVSVFIPGVPLAICMEVKKDEKAARSDEQKNMNARGCYPFVWSVEMAVVWVFDVLLSWVEIPLVGELRNIHIRTGRTVNSYSPELIREIIAEFKKQGLL